MSRNALTIFWDTLISAMKSPNEKPKPGIAVVIPSGVEVFRLIYFGIASTFTMMRDSKGYEWGYQVAVIRAANGSPIRVVEAERSYSSVSSFHCLRREHHMVHSII